ncbi:LysR substrate-binding domain-containing protein [Vibrio sp. NH-UV-68]|uniref:LysR family transcriptional regulator n=1 Tax=unclassified Vibrio TaxID=2614977 RepID=UPI0036F19967
MDLASRLNLLLEVSRTGSFAKAAERLNIDRSVLSKQIKQLEEHLGVKLINRTTRSMSLTSVGKSVVEQAEKVTQVLEDTVSIAQSYHNEPSGHLRVSSSVVFGRTYLQKAVECFLQRFPKATIELLLNDDLVDVVSEGFDLVFRIGPMRDSSMIARHLAENKTALVATKEFVETHGMPRTPEELAELPGVIYANKNFVVDKLQFVDGESGQSTVYPIKYNYRVNEAEMILASVKTSMGYAQLPQFIITEDMEELGLVQLLSEYTLASFGDIHVMYLHRKQSVLATSFIDIVKEEIGSPPVWEQNFR